MPSNLQKSLIHENLLNDFQQRFEVLFKDPEFDFKADRYLMTQIVASLTYEHFEMGENMLPLNEITEQIFFVHDAEVTVAYKTWPHQLLLFEQGSYFGDTSYLFKIINHYRYTLQSHPESSRIYSLHAKYLESILEDFDDFASVLKIRALRRHRYLRKLKN